MGRSRGGLTTKIHALVDANGLPIASKLTEGQAHDGKSAADMLGGIGEGQVLLADRGYDSDALRETLAAQGAWGNIKPMPGRVNIPAFSPFLYRLRNLVDIDQAWRLSRLCGGCGGAVGGPRRNATPGRRRRVDRLQRRDLLGIGAHQHGAFRAAADVAAG